MALEPSALNAPPAVDGFYPPYAGVLEMWFDEAIPDLEIPMTRAAAQRFTNSVKDPNCALTVKEVWDGIGEIMTRLFDEMETRGHFFYIPIGRAEKFEINEPFGELVSKKFPRLAEDIQEAHRCYACGRYTACVFHLMRIMEHSVQRLGTKLHVAIDVESATWQTILNHVNGAIKPMDHKKAKTKKLAEIASHLYNVKVAWRNEVMHPKQTYTEEEAEMLLKQVAAFLQGLGNIL